MEIVLTLIGIVLFFKSLNIFGLIVSIGVIIISEKLRKNNDSKFYSIASVLNELYSLIEKFL